VPLVDLLRPGVADLAPEVGRPDGIITDLGVAVGMLEDPAAEMVRQHLRAEADAEKRLLLGERDADPVDLPVDELVRVVGALRAAENARAGVLGEGFGQRIAEARPAHVQGMAALPQGMTDPPGAGRLLVQNDQDRLKH